MQPQCPVKHEDGTLQSDEKRTLGVTTKKWWCSRSTMGPTHLSFECTFTLDATKGVTYIVWDICLRWMQRNAWPTRRWSVPVLDEKGGHLSRLLDPPCMPVSIRMYVPPRASRGLEQISRFKLLCTMRVDRRHNSTEVLPTRDQANYNSQMIWAPRPRLSTLPH